MVSQILNFIDGDWAEATPTHQNVINPASAAVIAEVMLTPNELVAQAVEIGHKAFLEWRRVPVGERIQPLFKFKQLMEDNLDDLARTITNECGKTYTESVAEIKRSIENVEVACGMPTMMQGLNNEDIA